MNEELKFNASCQLAIKIERERGPHSLCFRIRVESTCRQTADQTRPGQTSAEQGRPEQTLKLG